MGLRLTLIGTFLPALLQPFLDGGLFLRLLLPEALMFPLVAGEGEICFSCTSPVMGHIANRVCGVIYEVAVPCGDGSFEMILLEAFWIDRIVIRQTAGQAQGQRGREKHPRPAECPYHKPQSAAQRRFQEADTPL